jgi:hypothetical protein
MVYTYWDMANRLFLANRNANSRIGTMANPVVPRVPRPGIPIHVGDLFDQPAGRVAPVANVIVSDARRLNAWRERQPDPGKTGSRFSLRTAEVPLKGNP